SPLIAVELQVLVRKRALPGVGHLFAAGRELVAPGEFCVLKTAARGELPLRLRRQLLAGPLGVRLSIFVGDVNDGMVVETLDPAAAAIWVAPIRAEPEIPPLAPIA